MSEAAAKDLPPNFIAVLPIIRCEARKQKRPTGIFSGKAFEIV